MYVPKVETQVQAALTRTRQRGKTQYDRSARPLASFQVGQTVRIQMNRGYDRLATVIGKSTTAKQLQQAGDATYVRNRRHLLHTPEQYTPPTTTEAPLNTTVNLWQNPSLMSTRCRNHLWFTPAQEEYQSPTLYIKTTLHKLRLFSPLLLQQSCSLWLSKKEKKKKVGTMLHSVFGMRIRLYTVYQFHCSCALI